MRKTMSGLVQQRSRRGHSSPRTVGVPPSVASGSEQAPDGVPAEGGRTYGNLWNILPPGSHGNVTTLDLATLVGEHRRRRPRRRNVADQLEMYDALTKHDPDRISQGRHRPALQARGPHARDGGEHEVTAGRA